MNQLTPPPERDLPARRHTQIRRTLTRHVSPTARPSRSLRTPVLAAGAVVSIAAVSMVGFSAWPGGDSTGPDPSTGERGEPSVAGSEPSTTDPVEWCRRDLAYFDPGPFRPGPGLMSADGTIQVMFGPGERWQACASVGRPQDGPPESVHDPLSDHVGEYPINAQIAPDGTYLQGVGKVPVGVDSVRFTFVDGHVEASTIEDGFWLMSYRASSSYPLGAEIELEVDGRSRTIGISSSSCAWEDGETHCSEAGLSPEELRKNAERG